MVAVAVEEGATFEATYRVGNGVAGNVGAGAIAHVVTLNGAIQGAANPIAAAQPARLPPTMTTSYGAVTAA